MHANSSRRNRSERARVDEINCVTLPRLTPKRVLALHLSCASSSCSSSALFLRLLSVPSFSLSVPLCHSRSLPRLRRARARLPMAQDNDSLPGWLRAGAPPGNETVPTPHASPSTARVSIPFPSSPESPYYMSMAQASSSNAGAPASSSARGGDGATLSDVVATVDATVTPTSATGARSGTGILLRSVPPPASVSLPSAAQNAPAPAPRVRYCLLYTSPSPRDS